MITYETSSLFMFLIALIIVLKLAFESDSDQLSWLKQFEKSGVATGQVKEVQFDEFPSSRGAATAESDALQFFFYNLPHTKKIRLTPFEHTACMYAITMFCSILLQQATLQEVEPSSVILRRIFQF